MLLYKHACTGVSISFLAFITGNHLIFPASKFGGFDGEERAGCFALFVFLMSRDCCVALPHDATGLPAVCDCGIS